MSAARASRAFERAQCSRRGLVKGLAIGSLALAARPALAAPVPAVKILSFENLHTGERLKNVAYYERGRYLPDALKEINHVLRDHRNDEIHAMDKQLLNILHLLHGKLESHTPFQIISGYRSPASNAMLNRNSTGVAKKSLHMEGKAADIRLSDRSLTEVRTAALAMGLGGVGFYPASNFVHVDSGRVRNW